MNRCDNAYCSSVCCMYAIKEAVIAKEHASYDLDCAVFYMDMRTHGKDFERFYNTAQDKGIRFLRSRVHTVTPVPETDDLEVRYVSDSGEMQVETFDMIVLSVGLEISPEVISMANQLGIDLTEGNFAKTSTFNPVAKPLKKVFSYAARFRGLRIFRNRLWIPVLLRVLPAPCWEPHAIRRQRKRKLFHKSISGVNVPRIGVFVCRCGINIAGTVNVLAVRDYASTLPYVEYVSDNLYSCSQDTQDGMAQIIKSKNLNRVVVAACTPKTHEPLFQETLVNAGLNKYLFEMANIRNHDSWVHRNNPDLATKKAQDLVRMAVSKVALMQPLDEAELLVNQRAMVIGGGITGMSTAKILADQGYESHIIERENQLGGQALSLYRTIKGEDIQKELAALIKDVEQHPNIHVHKNTNLIKVDGFVGNFNSTLSSKGNEEKLEHGITVIATGAKPLQTEEYLCGKDDRIITSLELDRKLIDNDQSLKNIDSAVFIQCVGSREPERPYCSRVCCTHSIDNALELKKLNPDMNVFILYRDLRTYGEKEYAYQKARDAGIIFIRFSLANKPKVELKDGKLLVNVIDHVLGRPVEIEADLLTLATAIVPYKDEQLAQFFKVPLNEDGFFVEKHAKLGPSEFATDGVFLCGLAHYPKPIDEAIAQGQAAASVLLHYWHKKLSTPVGRWQKQIPLSAVPVGYAWQYVRIRHLPLSKKDRLQERHKSTRFSVKDAGCALLHAAVEPFTCRGLTTTRFLPRFMP
jgi:heterodisulfide reductase subunit A2